MSRIIEIFESCQQRQEQGEALVTWEEKLLSLESNLEQLESYESLFSDISNPELFFVMLFKIFRTEHPELI